MTWLPRIGESVYRLGNKLRVTAVDGLVITGVNAEHLEQAWITTLAEISPCCPLCHNGQLEVWEVSYVLASADTWHCVACEALLKSPHEIDNP